jgi:hypothetical protein
MLALANEELRQKRKALLAQLEEKNQLQCAPTRSRRESEPKQDFTLPSDLDLELEERANNKYQVEEHNGVEEMLLNLQKLFKGPIPLKPVPKTEHEDWMEFINPEFWDESSNETENALPKPS